MHLNYKVNEICPNVVDEEIWGVSNGKSTAHVAIHGTIFLSLTCPAEKPFTTCHLYSWTGNNCQSFRSDRFDITAFE